MSNFLGKNAVITGAGSGIGRALAETVNYFRNADAQQLQELLL